MTAYRGSFSNDRVSDELELCAIDETTTLSVDLSLVSARKRLARWSLALCCPSRDVGLRLYFVCFFRSVDDDGGDDDVIDDDVVDDGFCCC